MFRRFSEESQHRPSPNDFVIRKRLPPLIVLALIFAGAFLILLLAAYNMENWGGFGGFTVLGLIIFGGLGWFTIAFTQRNRDLVMATEFQNMLFAAAAAIQSSFVLITKRDGTVVYFNPGFHKMFPHFSKRSAQMLDAVLENGALTTEEGEKIRDAIAEGVFYQTSYLYSDDEGKKRQLVLSVAPLPRPEGFSLVKCIDPEDSNAEIGFMFSGGAGGPAGYLLDNLVQTLPFGVYTLTDDKHLIFANDTFAMFLGEDHQSLTRDGPSFSELVSKPDYKAMFDDLLFSGEVNFISRNGQEVRLYVNQQALFSDDQSKIVGYKGLVQQTAKKEEGNS